MIPDHTEIEVLLGLGGSFRRVPLASISAITRVPLPILREACSRLVLSLLDRSDENLSRPEGEPTEREVRNVRSENVNVSYENAPNVSDGSLQREPSTSLNERNEPTDEPALSKAQAVGNDNETNPANGEFLAMLLDDPESRPFYDRLIETIPRDVIARALDMTLTRRGTIRGRPAAYFTAVVRRLSGSHPYARTTPTTP